MKGKIPKSTTITYKYDIRMTHIEASRSELLKKWTISHLNQIYYGRYLLLVSPIFKFQETLYVIPTLDVDTSFGEGFQFISYILKKLGKKGWFAEFTGKMSFHLYSRFLVKIPPEYTDITEIRQLILQPFRNYFDKIDSVSSIRNIPTVRIGKRSDTGKLAVPVLHLDKKWIVKASSQKTFEFVFPRKEQLVFYIREFLLPYIWIDLQTYYRLVRGV